MSDLGARFFAIPLTTRCVMVLCVAVYLIAATNDGAAVMLKLCPHDVWRFQSNSLLSSPSLRFGPTLSPLPASSFTDHPHNVSMASYHRRFPLRGRPHPRDDSFLRPFRPFLHRDSSRNNLHPHPRPPLHRHNKLPHHPLPHRNVLLPPLPPLHLRHGLLPRPPRPPRPPNERRLLPNHKVPSPLCKHPNTTACGVSVPCGLPPPSSSPYPQRSPPTFTPGSSSSFSLSSAPPPSKISPELLSVTFVPPLPSHPASSLKISAASSHSQSPPTPPSPTSRRATRPFASASSPATSIRIRVASRARTLRQARLLRGRISRGGGIALGCIHSDLKSSSMSRFLFRGRDGASSQPHGGGNAAPAASAPTGARDPFPGQGHRLGEPVSKRIDSLFIFISSGEKC